MWPGNGGLREAAEQQGIWGEKEGVATLASLPSNEVLQDTPCIFMFLGRAVTRDPGGASGRVRRGSKRRGRQRKDEVGRGRRGIEKEERRDKEGGR